MSRPNNKFDGRIRGKKHILPGQFPQKPPQQVVEFNRKSFLEINIDTLNKQIEQISNQFKAMRYQREILIKELARILKEEKKVK